MKANRKKIRVAIAGLGNCASALVQVVYYSQVKGKPLKGIMHENLGGYSRTDVEFSAAFEVSNLKIGRDISEAIYLGSNCTEKICDVPFMGVTVSRGPVLDGVAPHMVKRFSSDEPCELSKDELEEWERKVVSILVESKTDMLLNYMPVGGDDATQFYLRCAYKAHCSFINCMPSKISAAWRKKFAKAGLVLIGSDIKSQVGASILDRWVARLLDLRGSKIKSISQDNRGNGPDFENMQDITRLGTKYRSKRRTVMSNISQKPQFHLVVNGLDYGLEGDHKVCELKFRSIICGTLLTFDGRLEVVDSYNSAGVVIDAIRVVKIAMDRGISGAIIPACAYFMKSPPVQMEDTEASRLLEEWINDGSRTIIVPHSRIRDVALSGQKHSEVMSQICYELCANAYRNGMDVEVMSPKKYYHDEKEFLECIREALMKLMNYPAGYLRNLVIPFSIVDPNLKRKLIDLLREYPEVNIYGINVPPDEDYLSQVPNICGYAGLDEFKVGSELYQELKSRAEVKKVLVIRHEENKGLDMRIDGIIKEAAKDNVEVVVLGAYQHRQIRKVASLPGVGIITLGCRGTEVILGLKIAKIPMVCMDSNRRIDEAMVKNRETVLSSFRQDGLYEGTLFSGIINCSFSSQKVTA